MVTNTDVANSFLQKQGGSLTKFLDSNAFDMSVKLWLHLLPRHQSPHDFWEFTPASKISGGDFGTHIYLGLWGLVAIGI